VHGCFCTGTISARCARVTEETAPICFKKISRNRERRDHASVAGLTDLGWKMNVIWDVLKDEKPLRHDSVNF